MNNTTISEITGQGIEFAGANAANDAGVIDNTTITRTGAGVRISNRALVAISNSNISLNNAVASTAAVSITAAVAGSVIDLENCQVNFNSVAFNPMQATAFTLSNTHITGNGAALNFNGGTIASFRNNRIAGNNCRRGLCFADRYSSRIKVG